MIILVDCMFSGVFSNLSKSFCKNIYSPQTFSHFTLTTCKVLIQWQHSFWLWNFRCFWVVFTFFVFLRCFHSKFFRCFHSNATFMQSTSFWLINYANLRLLLGNQFWIQCLIQIIHWVLWEYSWYFRNWNTEILCSNFIFFSRLLIEQVATFHIYYVYFLG